MVSSVPPTSELPWLAELPESQGGLHRPHHSPHSQDPTHLPCPRWELNKISCSNSPLFSPLFPSPSCLYSQVPRLLRKLTLAWKLGVRQPWLQTSPNSHLGGAGTVKESPHLGRSTGGLCPLMPSQFFPPVCSTLAATKAHGPVHF